jgi:hypothetical protein
VFKPGDIISYIDMCREEGASLQAGMNFRMRSGRTVVLMSRRRNAPYADSVEDGGRTIIYEGHDARRNDAPFPKLVDQPRKTPSGSLTQNGKFERAAKDAEAGTSGPESVRVYEKLHDGIWVFNGTFALRSSWLASDGNRNVFRFRLEIIETDDDAKGALPKPSHDRVIPTAVKLEVWRRDEGRCVRCGATDNLHFDHVLPYSLGGASVTAANVQILCARHNLQKGARIE